MIDNFVIFSGVLVIGFGLIAAKAYVCDDFNKMFSEMVG